MCLNFLSLLFVQERVIMALFKYQKMMMNDPFKTLETWSGVL